MSISERVPWAWVLVGWTLFLWISRLRNVLSNAELSSGGRAARVAVVIIFVTFAIAAATVLWKKSHGQGSHRTTLLNAFVIWTVGYWLVRGIGILIDGGYSVGFKAVHTVLMAVSLTLSYLTTRQLRSGR